MDRLGAFYHWNDEQSLEQALGVAKAKRVNLKQIRAWSGRESMAEKFKILKNVCENCELHSPETQICLLPLVSTFL